MVWTWQTRMDGVVEVDRGAGFEAIALAGPDAQTARTEKWAPIVQRVAAELEVPPAWVLATIYAESGGNPLAVSPDGGYGLMQLTPPKNFGLSTEQALDPEQNIRAGAGLLAKLRRRGWDLPRVASGYNAGAGVTAPHPDAKDPWGFKETRPASPWTGYIEKVVRAANFWSVLEDAPSPKAPAPAPRRPGALLPILLLGVGIVMLEPRLLPAWLTPGVPPPGPFG